MYKVGILLMGKPDSYNPKVKQIVLEVEAKTKAKNLIEYLLDLNKIENTDVYIALEKNGRGVGDDSTISQMLKHVRPANGVIKLYLYQQTPQQTQQKLQLKKSRHELSSSAIMAPQSSVSPGKNRKMMKNEGKQQEPSGCCC